MSFTSNPNTRLDTSNHGRDSAGMTYVYPVISRRAGGVSIGINLNPNNACNWHCIYCQVPNLKRGGPPPIDLALLESELRGFLRDALHGNFMAERVPEDARRLEDIAFSGNGEPTCAREFPQAVDVVARVLREYEKELGNHPIKLRLITNGSMLGNKTVQAGIACLGRNNGEVWFKVDAGSATEIARINGVSLDPAVVIERVRLCAKLCPTWVQTCLFATDGFAPDAAAIDDYLGLLRKLSGMIAGVHLYGIARPSLQAEAPRLTRLSSERLESLAQRIRENGLIVCISP